MRRLLFGILTSYSNSELDSCFGEHNALIRGTREAIDPFASLFCSRKVWRREWDSAFHLEFPLGLICSFMATGSSSCMSSANTSQA